MPGKRAARLHLRNRGLGFEQQEDYDASDELTGDSMTYAASNFDNQSLRSFLSMVEADYPDELLRIRAPVDTRFDMTAIVASARQTSSARATRARRHDHVRARSASG